MEGKKREVKIVNIGGLINPVTYGLSDYGSRLRSRASPLPTFGQDHGFTNPGRVNGFPITRSPSQAPSREITTSYWSNYPNQ